MHARGSDSSDGHQNVLYLISKYEPGLSTWARKPSLTEAPEGFALSLIHLT